MEDRVAERADELFGDDRARLGLYEALCTCRAIRRLRPDPVPDAALARVLRAATCAPSGGNAQPWRVVVVRDAARKRALGALFRDVWETYSQPGREAMARLPAPTRARGERAMAAGDELAARFADVPVVLAWVHDPRLLRRPGEEETQPQFLYGASLYPAVYAALLACRAEGLGGVLTTMTWRREEAVRAALEVPEPWRLHALVPVGVPRARGHGPLARKPLETMAFGERFGAPLALDAGAAVGARVPA
ncbi:MAG: nitroreductase family protein [Myxococcales bacterium]|nr:nitroreductase family protein [Myxococcales bacterium]